MRARTLLFYVALALAATTFLYPFVWMVSTSFKPPAEAGTLSIFPIAPTVGNYVTMWERAPVGRAMLNSVFVATTVTASVLILGSLPAYALARLDFPGRRVIHGVTLGYMLVPAQLTLIPLYSLIVHLGWVDGYRALIVPYLFNAPAVLMLHKFFLQIPRSLVDAARLDGMSELRIVFRVFWPLARPALATVGIVTFMGTWNEVLWPLLVVRDQSLMTMPQLLTVFTLGGGAGTLGVQLAAAMVLTGPVIVAYLFLQRQFIESMAGGVKG
jgi:multiple sugar transport system permease protein